MLALSARTESDRDVKTLENGREDPISHQVLVYTHFPRYERLDSR